MSVSEERKVLGLKLGTASPSLSLQEYIRCTVFLRDILLEFGEGVRAEKTSPGLGLEEFVLLMEKTGKV